MTGNPRSCAADALLTSISAAPSFTPLALPAVTSPSFVKTGRSLARPSAVASGRTCSSVVKSTSCFLALIWTGTI